MPSASLSRTQPLLAAAFWLSYLFVLFYIAIAAGAVTHADLLLENPVKLPFLSVELPLRAFFFLSPLLFLITYAYTLAHLVLLADRAKRFHALLKEQINRKETRQEVGRAKRQREFAMASNANCPAISLSNFSPGRMIFARAGSACC
jgi:hypothetical protein